MITSVSGQEKGNSYFSVSERVSVSNQSLLNPEVTPKSVEEEITTKVLNV